MLVLQGWLRLRGCQLCPFQYGCGPLLSLQAFTETQKKRLLSWKQQVLKLLRTFPRKAVLDMQGYRPQKG